MKIDVFGMGYVGCVTAACLAKEGHLVKGIDLDPEKVAQINNGQSPILETGLEQLLAAVVQQGRLMAVTQARRLGDVSLVCVGTPSNDNGSLNLNQVFRVCENIADLLKNQTKYHVVNIRSTVLPGTVENLLIPLIEKHSGKIAGKDFGVSMNPEFLRESTAIKDFHNPPFTVIGALDERTARTISELYSGISADTEVVSIRVAEMIKYACNSFHGLKIAFANEIGNICKTLNIDSWQVMDVFCMDTKLNLSPYYLKPGFAFGGSCLPKDLRAIVHMAKQSDLEVPVLSSVLTSNHLQIERAYDLIRKAGKRNIGVLGLSFKSGSDDLRESPTVALVERLIGKGYSVSIYDNEVSLPELRGKNKCFIERMLPHISSLLKPTLSEVCDSADVIAVCKKEEAFTNLASSMNGVQVLDLVRVLPNGSSKPMGYQGICW